MTTTITPMSRYDRRIELVKNTLRENSKLSEKDATALAAHVLHAMDHIAETVR
ncbi:DUF6307 family protein [Crossiella sp. SN42]|uniref:DUF6307 family protein n=1 Tax=Crossiella sp. SN42 TaxID=2944808 RepID=UPI00207CE841|nr:DUF6307 family protein [Crossiella sp. SN42]MCO1581003.1 DUF6307 family protein [Crossiella sp. SN42]